VRRKSPQKSRVAASVLSYISAEYVGPGNAKLADFPLGNGISCLIPDGHLHPRERQSHGAWAIGAIHPIKEADRCCFRDAVPFPQREPKHFLPAVCHRYGKWGAATDRNS
jgi:hypothetical protein